jgi:hypothetical protein
MGAAGAGRIGDLKETGLITDADFVVLEDISMIRIT